MRAKLAGCVPAIAFLIGLALVALALTGCPGAGGSPEVCMAPKLAAIETAFVAEAVERCKGQGWQSCDAREEIDSKFDRMREDARRGCE